MSKAIAQQLALVFMGRTLDSQWASSTANLLNGSQPSVALQTAFYNAAVAEGVFSTSDSPSALVNDIFQNIFGFGASTFEQTAWGNLITNGTITKETAAWTIFKSYLGATNVPDAYKLPAQSKLVAMNAYSAELLADAEANLALAGGGTAAATARAYVSGVTSQASAATAIAGVAASVDALTVVPGTTYTLTTGDDQITGGSGNDTFIEYADSQARTPSFGDSIDGGAGTDTYNMNIDGNGAFVLSALGNTVKNVEVLNLSRFTTNVAGSTTADVSAWAGLTTANVTVSSTAAPVELITAGNVTSATITGATTTTITDEATVATQKLATVAISGAGAVGVTSAVLTNLSVTGGGNNVIINNIDSTIKTLGLTINGQTTGALDDVDIYTTLNVTTTGEDSTLSNITFGAATALNVAGSKALTLTSTSGLSALKTVAVSGTVGLTANFTQATPTTVTSVDTSATTGTSTVTIDATKATFTGGAGVDKVTSSGNVSKAISLGAGNDTFVLGVNTVTAAVGGGDGTDTLSIAASAAAVASADSTFAGLVTGFDNLTLTGATSQTIDLAVLGNYTKASTSGGNGLTLNKLASGGTLTLTGSGTAYTVGVTNAATGTADVLNLSLTSAGPLTAGSVTAADVETVNISLVDTDTTKQVNTLTLVDAALKTVVITGNAGLTLTNTDTTVTSVDASAVTNTAGTVAAGPTPVGTGFTWATGALAAASTIKGTSTGGDVIDAALALKAVTITAYAGTNVIIGSSAEGSTLTGGSGADTIVGGAGNDVIVGGGGADVIRGGAGADSITLSGTTATFQNVALPSPATNSGVNTATTNQTSELTSTFDIVRGVAAGDKFQLATFTPAVNLTATNLAGTDNFVNFARGTYDGTNGVFTYGAAGADTAVTYDTNTSAQAVAYETVILVGYVAASTTAITGGLITFA